MFSASSLASLTASNLFTRVSCSLFARSMAACFSLILLVQGCKSFCLTSIWSWKARVLSTRDTLSRWGAQHRGIDTFQTFLNFLERLFFLCESFLVVLHFLGLAFRLRLVLFDRSFRFGERMFILYFSQRVRLIYILFWGAPPRWFSLISSSWFLRV